MRRDDIEVLKDMARRVKNNVPNPRDPELFFEEKSEIEDGIKGVIKRASPQQNLKTGDGHQ